MSLSFGINLGNDPFGSYLVHKNSNQDNFVMQDQCRLYCSRLNDDNGGNFWVFVTISDYYLYHGLACDDLDFQIERILANIICIDRAFLRYEYANVL